MGNPGAVKAANQRVERLGPRGSGALKTESGQEDFAEVCKLIDTMGPVQRERFAERLDSMGRYGLANYARTGSFA